MKLALIPPPNNAVWMEETDYQLILPSFLQSSIVYRDKVRVCRGRGDFIILDNGVAEGLGIDSEDELYALAKEYQVTEVVIPDVYGDCDATLERFQNWKYDEDFGHMAVLAATTTDEVMKMLDVYCDAAIVDTIGVPRLLWDHGISRSWVAGMLLQFVETTGLAVHFLGMNPDAMYEMLSFPIPGVRSVDTSAPFVYAKWGVLLARTDHHWPAIARGADYDKLDLNSFNPPGWGSTANTVAGINARYLKERVSGETPS
jgi:hypothetical protein